MSNSLESIKTDIETLFDKIRAVEAGRPSKAREDERLKENPVSELEREN